ncbi:MAG TPA: hypothetical protein VFY91_03995 [Microbacterium sp.]|nr:hypothetical protein [Microbacterium sp.]
MFFDGYAQEGACPENSRGHIRENRFRHNFASPYDVVGTPTAQTQRRFCGKCHVLVTTGASEGRCAGGKCHFAPAYAFALPHLKP